jgi:hypothetical protein
VSSSVTERDELAAFGKARGTGELAGGEDARGYSCRRHCHSVFVCPLRHGRIGPKVAPTHSRAKADEHLSWDATGGDAGDAILIATLAASPDLFKADILLV